MWLLLNLSLQIFTVILDVSLWISIKYFHYMIWSYLLISQFRIRLTHKTTKFFLLNLDFSNLDKHPPLSYYLHSIKLNICMHKSNFCVFPFLRITYFLIKSFLILSGKKWMLQLCHTKWIQEISSYLAMWFQDTFKYIFCQCLSFGPNLVMFVFGLNCATFQPLGSHYTRCCFCKAIQADWQYH